MSNHHLETVHTAELTSGDVIEAGHRIVVKGRTTRYEFRAVTRNHANGDVWVTVVKPSDGQARSFHPSQVRAVVKGVEHTLAGWEQEVDPLERAPAWMREARADRERRAAAAAVEKQEKAATVGKVRLPDLVTGGVVPAGTVLSSDHGEAKVLADGRLLVHRKRFKTPTEAAAEAVGKAAGSGWSFWRLPDGRPLGEARHDYCTGGA